MVDVAAADGWVGTGARCVRPSVARRNVCAGLAERAPPEREDAVAATKAVVPVRSKASRLIEARVIGILDAIVEGNPCVEVGSAIGQARPAHFVDEHSALVKARMFCARNPYAVRASR